MIPFSRQLRFLLWKGVVVKRRQKAWLAIEIIIPILLFAILALVRTGNFNEDFPTCHYTSKGFPSSGILPFANGWLCSFMNNCNGSPTSGDEKQELGGTNVKQSIIVEGVRAFADQLNIIGMDPQDFSNALTKAATLIHRIAAWNGTFAFPEIQFKDLFNSTTDVVAELQGLGMNTSFAEKIALATITPAFFAYTAAEVNSYAGMSLADQLSLFGKSVDLFCDPKIFDESFILPNGENLTEAERQELCKITVPDIGFSALGSNIDQTGIVEKLTVGLDSPADFVDTVKALLPLTKGPFMQFMLKAAAQNTTDIVNAITCGQSLDQNEIMSPTGKKENVRTVFDDLRDNILKFIEEMAPSGQADPEGLNCSGIPIVNYNCTYSNNVLLQQFLPMMQGKILVAPAGPLADKLVEKLNSPLRYADFLRSLFPRYADIAIPLQQAISQSDLPAAANNLLSYLRQFFPETPPAWLNRLENMVDHLFASPNDPQSFGQLTKNLADLVDGAVECLAIDRFVIVEDEFVMEQAANCLQLRSQYYSGIVLKVNATDTVLPNTVAYKIRHQMKMVDSTTSIADAAGNVRSRDKPVTDLKYTTFGFSYIQEAVDKALREMMLGVNETATVGSYSQQEPYPCYVQDTFQVTLFLSLFVILSWMVPSALLVKNIVYEKEQRLKELMRIMGLGDTIHFVSWAIVSLVLNMVSILFISLLLKFGRILPDTDFSLLFVFLFLFSVAVIAQSLLLSTFFSNANIATACSAIIFFLCFYPFQLSVQARSSVVTKISLFFPQTAMGFGMTLIALGNEDGAAKWRNIGELSLANYDVDLASCLIALAADCVIYCILAWYISAIHPGVHGISQPWYFFLKSSYWFPTKIDIGDEFVNLGGGPENECFEREPVDVKMTVFINGLEKIYNNGMKALDGLHLRLYEGTITGLLGHNGAGKTTTMSMLCGLFSPSGGTASIYGRDLRREMRAVRETLGICPQHNVIFDVLTVYEQLYFYAALKGVSDENLENEVREIIDSTGLGDKTHCLSGSLSGGQKRRLCIGMALIGGSQFVILDEPTAGVDVNSRKGIWRLLMRHKKERTILLSTHHMDEADILSDRIAILSEGKLAALGSSVFLKNRFGTYMTLTCIKKDRGRDYTSTIETVCGLHQGLDVRFADSSEDELSFYLPIETDSQVLEGFFRVLDENINKLGIREYGISAPTLQEIFVSLAPQADLKLTKVSGRGAVGRAWERIMRRRAPVAAAEEGLIETGEAKDNDVYETSTPSHIRPPRARHVTALLKARANYTKRSLMTLCFVMVAPILLLLACEMYAKYVTKIDQRSPQVSVQPPLMLVNSLYGNNSDTYLALWDRTVNGAGYNISKSLLSFPGMGTRCDPDAPINRSFYPCNDPSNITDPGTLTFDSMLLDNETATPYNVEQTCGKDENAMWNCTQNDYPMDTISQQHAQTSDYLYDFSYRNISQFRLITEFLDPNEDMRNASYFFTGGVSSGHENDLAADGDKIKLEQQGWRDLTSTLQQIAPIIQLDLSNITLSMPIDPFYGDMTMDTFMDGMLSRLDTKDAVKLWYNNKRWASLPIYTNVLSNALLRITATAISTISPESLGIITYNHPMNATLEDSINQNAIQKTAMFRVVLLVLALSVIPAGFAIFLVEERVSHSFHLQIVSGLTRKIYWATSYLFDMNLYFISVIGILLIYYIMGVQEFTYNFQVTCSFFLLFVIYGAVDILVVYILQRNFGVAALAFVMISIGSFFVGIVTTMTVMLVEQLMKTDESLIVPYNVCSIVFLLVPQYNLGMAIYRGALAFQSVIIGRLYLNQINRMDLVDLIPMPDILEWDLMGKHVAVLSLQVAIGVCILIFLEHGSLGIIRRIESRRTAKLMNEPMNGLVDVDVRIEEEKVEKIETTEDYGLVVRRLAKAFGNRLIVRGVSFAVERGECFGLLGLNGAGKTTTFGMMTGKLDIGLGEVSILGERVSSRASQGFRHLGYCPQFDALNMKLTTRENVEFYARIRGLDERSIPTTVRSLLRSLHLLPYADILTSALSGGNRRKLSVAVALVSQPPVIMLDEPSAGMDPGSQQFLWTVIAKLRKAGRAVVLTSHSMEECEALCTRIAILDAGRVRCIGSKQHLKNRFGEGFSLTIKFLRASDAEESLEFFSQHLPKAKLVAVHCSAAYYRIPSDIVSVTEILQIVNKYGQDNEMSKNPDSKRRSRPHYGHLNVRDTVKEAFPVEDFSLSQTTLDEIFQFLSESSPSKSSLQRKRMFGLRDDFDVIEEENTIKGRELKLLCVIYVVLVLLLISLFEAVMPVLNNPSYPFYNHIPNYTFPHSPPPQAK